MQNLNLAVSDPASQPYVTAVGGTSFGHRTATLGPPHGAGWNDALYYSEGAGGGGISRRSPCRRTSRRSEWERQQRDALRQAGGDCREVPDVSADADPSSGYVMYDSVNGMGWNALGGTSGRRPSGRPWSPSSRRPTATRPATAAEPRPVPPGQQSPGTYFNDVTVGEQRLQRHRGGQYPAMPGLRHGHRPGYTGGVGAGRRPHRHPAAGRGVGNPDLRGVADLHRGLPTSPDRGRRHPGHAEHQWPHLHHRGHVTAISPTLARGLHPAGLVLQGS